jgi:CMP-N-acetylneuraminic acid synthetase
MKIAAIIPMRHSSVRVPGKNYRDFAGRPLYEHIIETLLTASVFSDIVVDTDSDLIIKQASERFDDVTCLRRPEALRGDKVSMNDVLLNTCHQVEADYYLQTHSTNPLLKPETVRRAVERMVSDSQRYDSLFSVTAVQKRFWRPDGSAINHDPDVLLRTQDLPVIYEENSCIYIFSGNVLNERKNRIGYKPILFEMDGIEAVDIDTETDFLIAENLFKSLKKDVVL